MKATVTFRHQDTEAVLFPGDVVGRIGGAALQIDDARVSEAHAMVSLREGRLRLLALRGALSVRGRQVREVELVPGQSIGLAPQVDIEVVALSLPEAVLGIEGSGLSPSMLPPVACIHVEPIPRVVARYDKAAPVLIWSVGEQWRVRTAESPEPRLLRAGETITVGDHTFRAVPIALDSAGTRQTALSQALAAPLHIVAQYDVVVIHRKGQPAVQLQGVIARMLTELMAVGGLLSWRALAGEIWPREEDEATLRHRLDANMSRLRSKLRGAGIRTDLVRLDGGGHVQFVRYPHDEVEVRS